MGRLLLFAFGLLLGAAGVVFLYEQGFVHAHLVAGTASIAAPSATAPPPPNSGVILPALPSEPPRAAPALIPVATPPLPAPEAGDATTAAADAAESPGPALPEAKAALVAAHAVATTQLLMPVQGIKPAQLMDTYTQARGEGRLHDAIDIMAPRGTPVFAVADGKVAKLFNSVRGGLTVYQFDGEEKLAYYYAHLDRYAPALVEGAQLKRGDVLGYVGSTGNANPAGPHLHFAVFVLGPEKHWWQGTAVNPYPLLGGR